MTTAKSPQRTYQPGELTWAQRSSLDIASYLERHPLVAQDPHAEAVLLQCAALVWEKRVGSPVWASLSVSELFRRLKIDQAFYPDPTLVLAYYEVLHTFIAWLTEAHRISAHTCDTLLDDLAREKTPLVDDARKVLRARREARERKGAWHEVLKTMGP
jgi:hypothetical protein